MNTYCNPLNVDYTYMIYNAYNNISYRSGADPAVVRFRDEYYMFVTRSLGYWHSTDLLNWTFINPEKWYFQGCNAPAAFNYKDSVLYVAGDPSGSMSLLYTDNPKKGDWKAVLGILNDLQDPDLFLDDDGKAYMFWGSSNVFPIRAKTLDKEQRFRPSDSTYALFNLDGKKHGWERFGENHSDTVLGGYIEGPWLTKHNNKYYMQYAAPGTEFNVYGDGVYIADAPLGPYRYAPNNPISYKPGGFMNGAGHGSTVVGPGGRYWHFASNAVAVNVGWERRLCMFPTYFDKDDLMYCDTYFGDYPHFAPATASWPFGGSGDKSGTFTGWMLLSYKKPVKASSQLGEYAPERMLDESVKTFWIAEKNDDKQWIEIDLQKPAKVHAIQVNYHDYKSDMYGRIPGLHHRYVIEGSTDGRNWIRLVDRENSFKDTPNDYVELSILQTVRYIRYRNIHVPTPYLSISGLRVFGMGTGKAPAVVKNFSVQRKTDRRDAMISWNKSPDAQGYNILWGIAPDKLYSSWMIYDNNSLDLKSLTVDQSYYFSIEAFNENGISTRTKPVRVE
ncbi:family 43 glycosylhydrolase [Chitinophagaceae bacterium LB-8]|uniref:Family 43 glycosylhydrolase n=1 Tax=Paraflavisolibacter caeni TaxID=2982496 RepID=A0A9X2XPL6_9BACT|nr:family 43 glycosylhydrolase [Paraflavisolibacter caeni]MCU7551219.1 family 43 glycosylhydrolase [Paraflavisolibacter caeni]